MGLEVTDFYDYRELIEVYKKDKLRFGLIMMIYLGGIVEIASGKEYTEIMVDKSFRTWEHYVILFCFLSVRYTVGQAIVENDPIVGTVGVLIGIWYSWTVLGQPIGPYPTMTTYMTVVTTLVGGWWLYLTIRNAINGVDDSGKKSDEEEDKEDKDEEVKDENKLEDIKEENSNEVNNEEKKSEESKKDN